MKSVILVTAWQGSMANSTGTGETVFRQVSMLGKGVRVLPLGKCPCLGTVLRFFLEHQQKSYPTPTLKNVTFAHNHVTLTYTSIQAATTQIFVYFKSLNKTKPTRIPNTLL